MEDTFEELGSQPSTGHTGTLKTLFRTLQDGRTTLDKLGELLKEVNKDVAFLDSVRRQMRAKGAAQAAGLNVQGRIAALIANHHFVSLPCSLPLQLHQTLYFST